MTTVEVLLDNRTDEQAKVLQEKFSPQAEDVLLSGDNLLYRGDSRPTKVEDTGKEAEAASVHAEEVSGLKIIIDDI